MKLPVELVSEIVSHCSPATLAVLCRCSQAFKRLGTSPLYKNILLVTPHALQSFPKTIVNSQSNAKFINSFIVQSSDLNPHPALAVTSLRLISLQNLECLTISIPDVNPVLGLLLKTCTFPKLHTLCVGSMVELPDDFPSFLSKHGNSLINLTIQNDYSEFLRFDAEDSGHIILPKLRTFSGPVSVLQAVLLGGEVDGVGHSPVLESAIIEWYSKNVVSQTQADFAAPFSALVGSLAKETCQSITCRMRAGKVEDLVNAIAEYCPKTIAHLSVLTYWDAQIQLVPDILQAPFAKMTNLKTFTYHGVMNCDQGIIDDQLKTLGTSLQRFRYIPKKGRTKEWVRSSHDTQTWTRQ